MYLTFSTLVSARLFDRTRTVRVHVCEQSKPALYSFTRDAVSTPRKPGGSRTLRPHTHLNKTNIFRRCQRSPVVRTCRNIDRQYISQERGVCARKHP